MNDDEDFDDELDDDDPIFAVISPIKRTKWAFLATVIGGVSAMASAAAHTVSGMCDDWATMCIQRDLYEQQERDKDTDREKFAVEASKDIEALKGFWITPEVDSASTDADRVRVDSLGDADSE